MKSLSEIETTSKRASRAVGFSWGEAEEIGKSIRLLEFFGLSGIKILYQYFELKKQKKFNQISLLSKNNNSDGMPYCPILLGINFLDQIRTLETFKKIRFNKISFPLLLIPFLSRSSEVIGKRISINFDKIDFLLSFNQKISSNLLNESCPIIANNAEINIIENKDNFSLDEWEGLYSLSEKTFVDETDSLKHGAAGAGLTDND